MNLTFEKYHGLGNKSGAYDRECVFRRKFYFIK